MAEMDEESFNGVFKQLAQDCKNKEGASDDDIECILGRDVPSTKPGQCLFVCLLVQYGMVYSAIFIGISLYNRNFNKKVDMKDENTAELSIEGFTKLAKLVAKEDMEKNEAYRQMAEECKGVTDPDRCDFGLKIITCLDNAAQARNMTDAI